MYSTILSLVLLYSGIYHVDPWVVLNLIHTESNYKVDAVGPKGELGLMQLLPDAFKGYTKKQLLDVHNNLRLGIQHLAEAKRDCKYRNGYEYLVCYNRGVKGGSKILSPTKDLYYRKVTEWQNNIR